MNTSRIVALAVLLLSGPSACGDSSSLLPVGEVQALSAAVTKWEATAPRSYVYTLERLCFCPIVGPVRVTVREGVVESARVVNAGADLTGPALAGIPTIDEVFDALSYALSIPAASFSARYDRVYGIPVEASIDHWARAVDDEITYRLSAFAPLP